MLNLKKSAFTLAEVLITLGIIGVVAAMTMPTLINSTKNKQLETAFKKIYSELSQATMSIITDNGGTAIGAFDYSENTPLLVYSKYLKNVKICKGGTTSKNCWTEYWAYSTGGKTLAGENGFDSLITPSGSTLLFMLMSSDCVSSTELTSGIGCLRIRVDVNGLKNPNVILKVIFHF